MKECCETDVPGKKRYRHWVVLGCVVLAAVGVQVLNPTIIDYHGGLGSPRVRAEADLDALVHSLDEYADCNKGAYPSSLRPLVTPDTNGNSYIEGYNGKIPKDPWKHEYQYEPPTAEHPKPHVWSFGADGKRGGSGDDADIDSDDFQYGR